MASSAKTVLATFVAVLLAVSALAFLGLPFAAASSTAPPKNILYVGVPAGTQATYHVTYAYRITYGGKLYFSGNYNYTLLLAVTGIATGPYDVPLTANMKLTPQSVEVSKDFNSTYAGASPPVNGLFKIVSEGASNISISPYFIISPDSQPSSSTFVHGEDLNVSVSLLPSYTYSHGEVDFNGPAIEQVQTYLYQVPGAPSTTRTVYVYDKASGLLIYSSNTTIVESSFQNSQIVINRTSTIGLQSTNVNTLQSAGTVSPNTSPVIKPPHSSSQIGLLFAVVIAVAVVVILVMLFFSWRARRV
ncbi:MAG: hypothetical protein QXI37_03900 [Thermoprotei archaeon]